MHVGIKLKKADSVWEPLIKEMAAFHTLTLIYEDETIGSPADIQLLITTRISEEEVCAMKKLEAIFLYKTGVDELPTALLQEKNIAVFPSYANAEQVGEHALVLALCLVHRVCEFDSDLRQGLWYADGADYNWESFSSLTAGILGYGHIGKRLAEKLSALSQKVVVFNKSGVCDDGYEWAKSLHELADKCDILFICIPKTGETVNLIDRAFLLKMKGKYIVNVSRAEICNEDDLYDALKNNILRGFASDVWYHPQNKDDKMQRTAPSNRPFAKLKNVVMSPHCATHEMHAHEKYVADAVRKCLHYAAQPNTRLTENPATNNKGATE